MERVLTSNLDWFAPVEPGSSMMGLRLGMSLADVRAILEIGGASGAREIKFRNSPRLIAQSDSDEQIILRGADITPVVYDWQNELAQLLFERGILSFMDVTYSIRNQNYVYGGKLFGKVGLGSRVSDMNEFAELEYDDVEEVFYSASVQGLELCGGSACDLISDPCQIIYSIKIF